MFKHLPVLGAVFPAAAALWFVHPNSATATVAGVSGAAALAEVKLRSMNEARKERKAAKAVAAARKRHEERAAQGVDLLAEALGTQSAALPPARGATIDYTAANARQLKRLV